MTLLSLCHTDFFSNSHSLSLRFSLSRFFRRLCVLRNKWRQKNHSLRLFPLITSCCSFFPSPLPRISPGRLTCISEKCPHTNSIWASYKAGKKDNLRDCHCCWLETLFVSVRKTGEKEEEEEEVEVEEARREKERRKKRRKKRNRWLCLGIQISLIVSRSTCIQVRRKEGTKEDYRNWNEKSERENGKKEKQVATKWKWDT